MNVLTEAVLITGAHSVRKSRYGKVAFCLSSVFTASHMTGTRGLMQTQQSGAEWVKGQIDEGPLKGNDKLHDTQ